MAKTCETKSGYEWNQRDVGVRPINIVRSYSRTLRNARTLCSSITKIKNNLRNGFNGTISCKQTKE